MQISVVKRDFVWNYAGLFFRMCSAILLLPLLLKLLPGDLLGMWYVFLSIQSFVAIFQASFAPSFARNVAYCWSGVRGFAKEGKSGKANGGLDFYELKKIIGACKRVFRLISVLVAGAMLTVGSLFVFSIDTSLDAASLAVSWGVFSFGVLLNVYFAYYESLLRGTGQFVKLNKGTIASSIAQLATVGLLLANGLGLLGCAIGYVVQGALFRLLCARYFFNDNLIKKGLDSEERVPTKEEIRAVCSAVSVNAYKDTAVSLANYFVTGGTTLLCSLFATLSETGTYSVTLQLFAAVANVSMVTLTTYQPVLQSAFANDDRELERRTMARVLAGFVVIYAAGSVAVGTIGVAFISWFREGYTADYALVVLLACHLFVNKFCSINASFFSNRNTLPYTRAFVISSMAGLVLSSVFMSMFGWGVVGLVVGQLIAQLAYNAWKWPHEAAKAMSTSQLALLIEGCGLWLARGTGGK